jgi:hypothetical protein
MWIVLHDDRYHSVVTICWCHSIRYLLVTVGCLVFKQALLNICDNGTWRESWFPVLKEEWEATFLNTQRRTVFALRCWDPRAQANSSCHNCICRYAFLSRVFFLVEKLVPMTYCTVHLCTCVWETRFHISSDFRNSSRGSRGSWDKIDIFFSVDSVFLKRA